VTVTEEQILINNSIVATDSIAATTVIAYFNAAVEYEYLGEWDFAKQAYEMALSVCKHSSYAIKTQNHMEIKLLKALQVVNMKVRNKVQRQPERLLKPL